MVSWQFLNMERVLHSVHFPLSFSVLCFSPARIFCLHCASDLKLKMHICWTFIEPKTSIWKCPQSVRRGWLPFNPLPCVRYLLNPCNKTCWLRMWQEFLVYISINESFQELYSLPFLYLHRKAKWDLFKYCHPLTGIISSRNHFHYVFIAQVSEDFAHQNLAFQFWILCSVLLEDYVLQAEFCTKTIFRQHLLGLMLLQLQIIKIIE